MIERGEIWWGDLPEPTASGPGFHRPVLIVQADQFNRSSIRTVVVAALTTSMRGSTAPGNVLLRRGQGGVPKDSLVNVSQLVTVDQSLLSERIGCLPARIMERVDFGLRLVLGL